MSSPSAFTSPILIICHAEYFQGKVLDICCASGFDVDCVVGANCLLHLFKGSQQFEEEISRESVLSFDRDSDLSRMISTYEMGVE